jgi:hypothetical protein
LRPATVGLVSPQLIQDVRGGVIEYDPAAAFAVSRLSAMAAA